MTNVLNTHMSRQKLCSLHNIDVSRPLAFKDKQSGMKYCLQLYEDTQEKQLISQVLWR